MALNGNGGEEVFIHFDQDGGAHLRAFRNPADVQEIEIKFLANRAMDALFQCRFRQFWITCWAIVMRCIPGNQMGHEPKGFQHCLVVLWIIVWTIAILAVSAYFAIKGAISHAFSPNGIFREVAILVDKIK